MQQKLCSAFVCVCVCVCVCVFFQSGDNQTYVVHVETPNRLRVGDEDANARRGLVVCGIIPRVNSLQQICTTFVSHSHLSPESS